MEAFATRLAMMFVYDLANGVQVDLHEARNTVLSARSTPDARLVPIYIIVSWLYQCHRYEYSYSG